MIERFRLPLLALVVLLQTAALVGMVAVKQRTLATGTPVLLKTAPVDPRSLFRGDYVVLAYEIGGFRVADFPAAAEFERFETVYVVLREGEEFWHADSIHAERPEIGPNAVVIRGEVADANGFWDPERRQRAEGIRVRYGIENYFVPEGQGREIELPRNAGKVSIEVAVDARGDAAIRAVLVDGEVRYRETLF